MKMKKLMALVLALTLVLGLAARRAPPPRAATPQPPPKASRP